MYPNSKTHKNSGFSLIEILFVMGLVALLLSLVVINVGGTFDEKQKEVAGIFVNQTIELGLVPYKIDTGNYPTTEQGLNALMKQPAGKEGKWKGPYLKELPNDPWDNPYQYRYPGSKNINGSKGYDVWSLGPDGVEGADDIGNW